jgi:hypothetical protein
MIQRQGCWRAWCSRCCTASSQATELGSAQLKLTLFNGRGRQGPGCYVVKTRRHACVSHVSFAFAFIHSIHTCMAFTGMHISAVPSAALIDFGKPVYLHT